MTRYSIETERLLLRPWRPEDRDAFIALATEPEFQHFPLRRAATPDEAAGLFDSRLVAHWRTHGFGMWAAMLKESEALIGYIGLAMPTFVPVLLPAVEVGWRLGRKWWGNGYATEGGRASLEYGFTDLLLNRLVCIYEPENVASAKVAERLGFREYLTTPDPKDGVPLTVAELTRTAWQRSAASPGR